MNAWKFDRDAARMTEGGEQREQSLGLDSDDLDKAINKKNADQVNSRARTVLSRD